MSSNLVFFCIVFLLNVKLSVTYHGFVFLSFELCAIGRLQSKDTNGNETQKSHDRGLDLGSTARGFVSWAGGLSTRRRNVASARASASAIVGVTATTRSGSRDNRRGHNAGADSWARVVGAGSGSLSVDDRGLRLEGGRSGRPRDVGDSGVRVSSSGNINGGSRLLGRLGAGASNGRIGVDDGRGVVVTTLDEAGGSNTGK
jgi:hypothetical protein